MVLRLRPGEWVEVKSEAEILATLDERSSLEGLPFMPEMRKFCGRRLQVRSRADRTVVEKLSLRRMSHAVHLEGARCDGAAHDACCRGCLVFWKEAWLRRVNPAAAVHEPPVFPTTPLPTTDGDRYYCQATQLGHATRHLPAHELRQFWEALTGEALRPIDLLRAMSIFVRDLVVWRVLRKPEWEWNSLRGTCSGTPVASLALQPGERVRVKSKPEILATLDAKGWNRGMEFSREMLAHCGREFTVARRVERIIRDCSAKMVKMANTVILEGLVYKDLVRLAAPRSEYMYWRECWLERVP
jgi:hypothetical protein